MTYFSQNLTQQKLKFSLIFLLFLSLLVPNISYAAINITNIQTEFEGEKVVKISWQTDIPSSGKIYYGTDKDYLPSFIVDRSASSRSHEVEIGNLSSDTKYYFKVYAQNGSETVESFVYEFETEEFNDKKAPAVSEQKIAWLSGSTASFSWLTDEKADGRVEYGLDKTYRFAMGGSRDVTEHLITIRNLKPNTRYFARLKSTDRDGNSSGYFHFEFRTRADSKTDSEDLEITNLRPSSATDSNIGATSLTVSFSTNHLAKGQVIVRGPGVGNISQPLKYNTNHSTRFTGLSRQSTYQISILMDDVFGKRETKTMSISTKRAETTNQGVSVGGNGSSVGFNSAAVPKTTLTCTSAIYDGYGYYGQYYNQVEDLRFPLNMEAEETGYFDSDKHELTQIDPHLRFARSFNGLGVRSNGSPFHFSGYWRGLVAVPQDAEYGYSIIADDNSWVYFNSELDNALNGKQLKSGAQTIFLHRGLHTIEIYFSYRGRTGSELTLTFDENARIFPLPVGCSAEDASKLIPNGNFDALFNINNPHPQAVGAGTGSGNGGVGVGNGNGSGSGQGGVQIGNGNGGGVMVGGANGDGVAVLGEAYSRYTRASALYRIEGTPDVYALMNGQLHYISSPASFREYGYSWDEVQTVGTDIFNKHPRARLIKSAENDTIYFLYQRPENQWLKIDLNSPTVFVSYPANYWGNVITVNQFDVDSYPDVELIKTRDSNSVYYLDIERDTKKAVSAETFRARGFNPHQIAEVNQIHLDSYLDSGILK